MFIVLFNSVEFNLISVELNNTVRSKNVWMLICLDISSAPISLYNAHVPVSVSLTWRRLCLH